MTIAVIGATGNTGRAGTPTRYWAPALSVETRCATSESACCALSCV
jgi:hypothetical protein